MSIADRQRALERRPELGRVAQQLEIYENLLLRWQSSINLVGRSTLDEVWTRHFLDSAQLADLAPLDRRWADLGSGAGFPGLVIALFQQTHAAGEMHLIESDKRKAAFLREVSREIGASAHIHNERCDDVLSEIQPEVVVSRAMTDIGRLIAYAQPFVEKGGVGLFPKGRDIVVELTRASIPSNFQIVLKQSRTDPEAAIVQVLRD